MAGNARFICIACHRSLSRVAGPCRRCGVDRLDLERADVREEVRQHAEKLLHKRMMLEHFTIGGIAAVVSGVVGMGLWLGYYDYWDDIRPPWMIALVCGVAARWLLLRLYLKLRPDAAILVYASRRGRHQRTLGIDTSGLQQDEDGTAGMVDVSQLDPEVADLEQLLRSMGATLDA